MSDQNIISSEFFSEPSAQRAEGLADLSEIFSSKYFQILKARRNGKWFVLKVLQPQYRGKLQYEALLRKEYEIGILFEHPNILRYVDLVQLGNLGSTILMEYVDGISLKEYLKDSHPLEERKKIILQIADALSTVHLKQVVHRDVTPSNILITSHGKNVKLIDFGISDADCYSVLKEPAGTWEYAAPEQKTENSTVDARTDIYSLGIILKEFHLPLWYRHIIEKCSGSKPDKRYSDIQHFTVSFKSAGWRFWSLLSFIIVVFAVVGFYVGRVVNNEQKLVSPVHTTTEVHKKSQLGVQSFDSDTLVRHNSSKPDRDIASLPKEHVSTSEEMNMDVSYEKLERMLHVGVDRIIDPYIEKRSKGMNIAEWNTATHLMVKKQNSFIDSLFSLKEVDKYTKRLTDEYVDYLNYKRGILFNSGKIRQLTPQEKLEIKCRQIPQLRKMYEARRAAAHQDTTAAHP